MLDLLMILKNKSQSSPEASYPWFSFYEEPHVFLLPSGMFPCAHLCMTLKQITCRGLPSVSLNRDDVVKLFRYP